LSSHTRQNRQLKNPGYRRRDDRHVSARGHSRSTRRRATPETTPRQLRKRTPNHLIHRKAEAEPRPGRQVGPQGSDRPHIGRFPKAARSLAAARRDAPAHRPPAPQGARSGAPAGAIAGPSATGRPSPFSKIEGPVSGGLNPSPGCGARIALLRPRGGSSGEEGWR
jgi:hypothetical protein